MKIHLRSAEAKLITDCLRGAHVQTLDALSNCAGKPWGERHRSAPNVEAADRNRSRLDTIERLCEEMGYPIIGRRREAVEAFYAEQTEAWNRLQHQIANTP